MGRIPLIIRYKTMTMPCNVAREGLKGSPANLMAGATRLQPDRCLRCDLWGLHAHWVSSTSHRCPVRFGSGISLTHTVRFSDSLEKDWAVKQHEFVLMQYLHGHQGLQQISTDLNPHLFYEYLRKNWIFTATLTALYLQFGSAEWLLNS